MRAVAMITAPPLGIKLFGFLPSDISIPKPLRLKDGRVPRFAEILGSALCDRSSFEEAGAVLTDNSPEQIRDLATEMLDVLDGKAERTPEDEVWQQAFRRLLAPHHYSYGSRARVGASFLREFADLL